MTGQHNEYTENHRTVQLKRVYFTVCELHLNKAVIKRAQGRNKQKKRPVVCLVKKVCDIFMKVRHTWFYESFTSVLF